MSDQTLSINNYLRKSARVWILQSWLTFYRRWRVLGLSLRAIAVKSTTKFATSALLQLISDSIWTYINSAYMFIFFTAHIITNFLCGFSQPRSPWAYIGPFEVINIMEIIVSSVLIIAYYSVWLIENLIKLLLWALVNIYHNWEWVPETR